MKKIDDFNDVDDPKNILNSEIHQDLFEKEILNIIQTNIKKQYIEYENLGQNYLYLFNNELSNNQKKEIFIDLINYVHQHILPIVDYDNIEDNVERILLAGQYIYELICVDFLSSILPALLEKLNITSISEFDDIINLKYLNTPGKFKTDLLDVIRVVIEQLNKLQSITPDVKNDTNYQKLLGKYFYYQEIITYTNTELFLNGFVRPVLSKYETDLIWKLL